MGTIYRKAYTVLLPATAQIVERDGVRIARWKLRNGKARSAEVVSCDDGEIRVRGRSAYFTAKYRNSLGHIVEISTKCRDETAARQMLAQIERRVELVRAGVLTTAEGDAADHAHQPVAKHLDEYIRHLHARGGDPRRISMVRRRLERLVRECRFSKINKMLAGRVEEWLVEQADAGMAASTRNTYRESIVGFGNFCRRTRRLTENPFALVPRADPKVDRKHQRRALTEEELNGLLKVARLRPLAEYGREIIRVKPDGKRSPRSRATWKRTPLTVANIDAAVDRAHAALKKNPQLVARLERTGRERALLYKTLVLTGLRKGELASLKVGDVEYAGSVAYAILDPANEKNRQGSNVPLRADLASELFTWLSERLRVVRQQARASGEPIPVRLPASTPLFNVPSGLARILDRDLGAAGISKRDERNRVIDVHALRVTFGTHLCAAGVPLRIAQAAMRHSKPELTACTYTDPQLLDVAGAINALPTLALDSGAESDKAQA